MRTHLPNGSAYFGECRKFSRLRRHETWKEEQRKEPFGVVELEEDVNPHTVHKEICRFYTKDSLVKAIARSYVGVKT